MSEYHIVEAQDVDLSTVGVSGSAGMEIEVVDPVAEYAALMERLFDFDAIAAMFAGGFTMRFDAMHAVTGPMRRRSSKGGLAPPRGRW
jgi:phosphoglucomutase